MDLSFSKYDFQKGGEQIAGYSISEINKRFIKFLYIEMGLSASSLILLLNHFPF